MLKSQAVKDILDLIDIVDAPPQEIDRGSIGIEANEKCSLGHLTRCILQPGVTRHAAYISFSSGRFDAPRLDIREITSFTSCVARILTRKPCADTKRSIARLAHLLYPDHSPALEERLTPVESTCSAPGTNCDPRQASERMASPALLRAKLLYTNKP